MLSEIKKLYTVQKGLDTESFIIFIDETCNLEVMMIIDVIGSEACKVPTFPTSIHFSAFQSFNNPFSHISGRIFGYIGEINEKFNANLLSTMNNANGCRSLAMLFD